MSAGLKPDQKDEIARRFDLGEPLDAIAADFGTYKGFVSRIAKQRGCAPRHVFRRVELPVKLLPAVYDRLRATADKQRTSPEVLAREAIAAYLGAE